MNSIQEIKANILERQEKLDYVGFLKLYYTCFGDEMLNQQFKDYINNLEDPKDLDYIQECISYYLKESENK
jgi:hypothetical protein